MDPQQMSEVTEIIQGPGTPEEIRRQVGEILGGGPVSAEASCTFKGELKASLYSSSHLKADFHFRLTAPADGKVTAYILLFEASDGRLFSYSVFINDSAEDLREVRGFHFFEIDLKNVPDVVEVEFMIYTSASSSKTFREKIQIR